MARLFTESFEQGHLYQWSGVRGTGASLVTSPVLDGAYAVRMTGGAFNSVALYYQFSSTLTEAYAAFYLRNNGMNTWLSNAPLFEFSNGTNQLVGVSVNGSNQLQVYLNNNGTLACTGTHILSDSTNYHIQLYAKIHAASGVITLKLNDVTECTFSGNTDPGSRTNFDNFCLGSRSQLSEIQYHFDNIIVNDTSGPAPDNTWPGITRFMGKVVVGPGFYVNNWSRNTGSTNWDAVEEIPPDNDTTYLYTSSVSVYESFSVTNPSLNFADFRALRTMAVVKKDTGTVKLAIGIRDLEDNIDYTTAAQDVGIAYGVVQERRTLDPSTSLSWSQSGLGAIEPLIISSG